MALYVDLFDTLDLDVWTEVDPLGDCTVAAAGELSIVVPSGTAHDLINATKNAPRIEMAANDTDLYCEVGSFVEPTQDRQFLGIYVEQDASNWLSWCLEFTGGALHLICRSTTAGTSTVEHDEPISSGGSVAFSFFREGTSWLLISSPDFEDYPVVAEIEASLTVTKAGIVAGTSSGNPAFSAEVGYWVYEDQDLPPAPAPTPTHPRARSGRRFSSGRARR